MLIHLSLETYAQKLASKEAAPGGGSAAAVSGLLAVSLMEMVIHLTLGRLEFAAHQEHLSQELKKLADLHRKISELVDRDAAAFSSVVTAFKLPKDSEADKAVRSEAIQAAFKIAAEIPLETAAACLEVLVAGKALLGKVNPHAVSDLAVGALAAYSAVEGALLNTAINLPSIKDQSYAAALNGRGRSLKAQAGGILTDIKKFVYQDPMFEMLRD